MNWNCIPSASATAAIGVAVIKRCCAASTESDKAHAGRHHRRPWVHKVREIDEVVEQTVLIDARADGAVQAWIMQIIPDLRRCLRLHVDAVFTRRAVSAISPLGVLETAGEAIV